MYSGTKLSDKGFKKLLESRLDALNFELNQCQKWTHPTREQLAAENALENQKQEVLKQLEAIETEELIAAGVLPLPHAGSEETDKANQFLGEVFDEYLSATQQHGGFNSAHEAYGVILEEVDEFWEEVKKKRKLRNTDNMRRELVQIAAMSLKAALVLT